MSYPSQGNILVLHATKHQDGGDDEVGVAALTGLLADDQHVLDAEVTAVAIALTQKAAASGVASLSATSLVVQKPADRLGLANFEWTADKLLKGAGAGADPTEVEAILRDDFDKRSFVNLLENGNFEVGNPPSGWSLAQGGTTASWARSAAQVKIGSYSGALTSQLDFWAFTYQDVPFAHLKGRVVTLGAWVWASVANRVMLMLEDGVGWVESSYHPGDSTWRWITATMTVAATATMLRVRAPRIFPAGAVTTAYIDGAILVEGDSCPAFSPKPLSESNPILSASAKINPVSGVAGFSVVSTALTLGSLGSVVIPQSAANASDALAGNIAGALCVDLTGAAERLYFRGAAGWFYISKTGGLSMTKEERFDPAGHKFELGDAVRLVVDKVFPDGSFHAIPYYAGVK